MCKFSEYVKYNNFKNQLLRYRENKHELLNIADKVWFYIRKIKKDMREVSPNEKIALDFFDEQYNSDTTSFEDIIKNDIIEFNKKYMK